MRLPTLALAFLLALAGGQLRSQALDDPAKGSGRPADSSFSKLRGISYFFIDVTTADPRPEDGDLRQEIRDGIELEMRRAGLVPKEYSGANPEGSTPLLTIEVRFDRGLGRYAAAVGLSVRDEANIRRNNQLIIAETYRSERSALGTSDLQLTRDIKAKAKELMTELLDGMAKAKGR